MNRFRRAPLMANLLVTSLCVASLLLAACMPGCGRAVKSDKEFAKRDYSKRYYARPEAGAAVVAGPKESDPQPRFNTEAYDHIEENPFLAAKTNPLSTFSIDVDTASYANVRRFLNQNQLPPPGAVRIEELINYFDYQYSQPTGDVPFSVNIELAACPWNSKNRLARIALKGRDVAAKKRPASNLVFLLDVSGSMMDHDKLPLVKSAMKLLVEQLGEGDRIAIVVYASATGMVLPSTGCDQKRSILNALDRLETGGSTNGGDGIQLAYRVAEQNFIPGGINRVILCTDGDFNVGVTNQGDLVRLIKDKATNNVFLSVLGFGQGNLKDSTMEKIANKGNGNYAYIDSLSEARKVLVEQISGTLITIAKDVKIQVDFNPARMYAYRLIGYENRMLRAEDFKDDRKDAGEIGAGHSVTALYEIVPNKQDLGLPTVEPTKYQGPATESSQAGSDELLTVRLRYKQPDGKQSQAFEVPVTDYERPFVEASPDLQFSAAVAAFGMLLRQSEHNGTATFDTVVDIAERNLGEDRHGYRQEFVQLARRAGDLVRQP